MNPISPIYRYESQNSKAMPRLLSVTVVLQTNAKQIKIKIKTWLMKIGLAKFTNLVANYVLELKHDTQGYTGYIQ